MPKYVVPSDCESLADIVLAYLTKHRGQETVDSVNLKSDLRRSLSFLLDVPDGARFVDFDILEEFSWDQETVEAIRRATD